jgi:hypothetical protein
VRKSWTKAMKLEFSKRQSAKSPSRSGYTRSEQIFSSAASFLYPKAHTASPSARAGSPVDIFLIFPESGFKHIYEGIIVGLSAGVKTDITKQYIIKTSIKICLESLSALSSI